MIVYINKTNTDREIFESLNPVVSRWFNERFRGFTDSQKYAIIPIRNRNNVLVSSPTGSGKTLCAFTSILNYLINLSEKNELENKVYAVYISPLKALSRDVEVNLKKPLEEIEKIAGKKFNIRVAVRTGDTSSDEKQKMLKNRPHILITTPESLAIILNAKKLLESLKAVEFAIVDEIHALANKRGVHLFLSLERLEEVSVMPIVRVGLSATIAPLEEIARFLVGEGRDCLIADVRFNKKTDISVLIPVADLINAKGLHSSLYKLIDQLIEKHKTTLIFTNTRAATERVVHHLKEMFPSKYLEEIGAHHSSLSKSHRFDIEQRLREGKLKVCVCSTSLELGIDIGYIDLVILLSSPKSSARAAQRIGRAGHKLHDVSKGRFITMDRDDLVECCILSKEAIERKVDKVQIPQNCLDVLSQQIYGMAIYRIWDVDEMFSLIKKSYCYRNLSKEDFMAVVSYLSGEYALEHKNIYAKIWYDKEKKQIGKRGKLARVIYMTNIGTIPEESFINVVIASGERKNEKIGVVDEIFLERLKRGDVFVLGGRKYQFLYTKGMNAYVNASVYKTPTIPSWFSEMLPLSFDSALEINRFRKLVDEKIKTNFLKKVNQNKVKEFIKNYIYCSDRVAEVIYNYFYEQYKFAKIPHENRMLVEIYKESQREGNTKNYVVFHSLYGRRVNDALSRAIGYLMGRKVRRDIEVGISDNGFYFAGENLPLDEALRLLKPENLREILSEAILKTEILKRRFRHCAARSLMILRKYKGRTKTVGRQQMKSFFLMSAINKISTDFPILKEARREVLEDLMDIENAKKVLNWIKEGKVKIEKINTKIPSPFALNLVLQGYSDLLKMEDKTEFLKRMHEEIMKEIKSKETSTNK